MFNTCKNIEKIFLTIKSGRCLYDSGLTVKILKSTEDRKLLDYKMGLVNMIEKPNIKSCQELTSEEIKEASDNLVRKIRYYRPKIVAFNGKTIYEIYTGSSVDKQVSSAMWELNTCETFFGKIPFFTNEMASTKNCWPPFETSIMCFGNQMMFTNKELFMNCKRIKLSKITKKSQMRNTSKSFFIT